MTIKITDRAQKKIKELVEIEMAGIKLTEQAGLYLRIGVTAGCCVSPKYLLEWATKTKDGDAWIKVAGIKILATINDQSLLENATLDYIILGPTDTGFKIENSNITPQCGC
ncbi:MAG: iron-sulfur cluster assembly accessory protein, partial [bacterium]|nr:iron-sulfur cluster assembly accessory protein [bacterium]